MNRKVIVFRHMIAWLIFVSYEIAFLYFTVGVKATFNHFLIYYLLNIGLFYFNAHVILNFGFSKTRRPYLISACLMILELSGYLTIKFGLDWALSDNDDPFRKQIGHPELYIMTNIWRAVYFVGLSVAYWSLLNFSRVRERSHLIEKESLRNRAENLELENKYISVENAFLQNQISPHLLFNSLSFIHNAIYLLSAQAGKGVMRLAELMRYSLVSPGDTRKVMLAKEVEQVENLIALCGMRFPNEFFLRFRKKGRLSGIQIIPLVLITLVENMMKHGDIGEKKQPARIRLEIQENQLLFETHNKKRKSSLYRKGGLGLKNVEKRLNNFYRNRYTLLIRDVEDFFTVTLQIEL